MAFGVGDALNMLTAAEGAINAIMPVFENHVEVTIVGDRSSSRRELYFLALALAFGKVQNTGGLPVPPGAIMMSYDCVEHVVKVTVHYRYGEWASPAGGYNSSAVITRGPDDVSIGGTWDYRAIFSPFRTIESPDLTKYTGLEILTPNAGQANPTFYNDDGTPDPAGGSRGTYLNQLIYQSLAFPCYDPVNTTNLLRKTAAKTTSFVPGPPATVLIGFSLTTITIIDSHVMISGGQ